MNGRLVIVISILALTDAAMVAILVDLISVGFPVGPFRFSLWMA
jgi:hypothetical protein